MFCMRRSVLSVNSVNALSTRLCQRYFTVRSNVRSIYDTKDINTKAGKLVDEIESQRLKISKTLEEPKSKEDKDSRFSYMKHLGTIIESENFQNLKKELSRLNEKRQSTTKLYSKDLSDRLDVTAENLKTSLKFASRLVNDVTGYTKIEQLKQSIVQREEQLQRIRAQIQDSKAAHETAVSERVASQKEVNALLERKHSWSTEDLERFTELYRDDHSLEQTVKETADAVKELEVKEEETYSQLIQGIMNRYHEEQVWSDRIRSFSTWGTLMIMAVNLLLFVVVQLFLEPFKRSRLVSSFEMKVTDLLDEKVATMQASLEEKIRKSENPTQLDGFTAVDDKQASQLSGTIVSFSPSSSSFSSIVDTLKANLALILINPWKGSFNQEPLTFEKTQLNLFLGCVFATGTILGVLFTSLVR
ncbi:unnamed protein product [Kuraishia capsulata CBS 1993]|uniref:Sensitive to high expression protein 9, mitochondrial n=1 Tax=Kuraishia capsulata CBS 1993 TaxID=1382522 RepID=W6MHA1_9ASCO|nr:uncharacterized protein KUCA_T00000970001 [Kuraishia capsulata CBS 1993]CDK25003.1 unnamed protein product [Kuraishia capsulata CBS 1993]